MTRGNTVVADLNCYSNECLEDIIKANIEYDRKVQKAKYIRKYKEREEYFDCQRKIGLLAILISICLFIITGTVFSLMLVIVGCAMILTKKMIIVNNYYWKHDGAEQWKI